MTPKALHHLRNLDAELLRVDARESLDRERPLVQTRPSVNSIASQTLKDIYDVSARTLFRFHRDAPGYRKCLPLPSTVELEADNHVKD